MANGSPYGNSNFSPIGANPNLKSSFTSPYKGDLNPNQSSIGMRPVGMGLGGFGEAEANRLGLGLALSRIGKRRKEEAAMNKAGGQILAALMRNNPRIQALRSVQQAEKNFREEQERKNENLQQRLFLRDDMGKAVGDEERMSALRERATELGVTDEQFDRIAGQDTAAAKKDKEYKDFFARANDPNRTLGVGNTRKKYSRKGKLRLARELKRKGFIEAANAAALDYARSPEASGPSTVSEGFMLARADSQDRVDAARSDNRRLQRMLMERMEERLKADPDFMPQGDFKFNFA